MLWVGAADVLLHGAVPLLLCSTACYSEVWGAVQCSGGARHDVGAAAAAAAPSSHSSHGDSTRGRLTPVQRLRQAELSWLRSGQTTTLFSSETEKDPVSEARGGMASIYPPCLCECAGRAQGAGLQDCRTAVQVEAAGGVWGVNGTCRALQRRGEAVSELENGNGAQKASSCSCSGSAHQAPQAKAGRG